MSEELGVRSEELSIDEQYLFSRSPKAFPSEGKALGDRLNSYDEQRNADLASR